MQNFLHKSDNIAGDHKAVVSISQNIDSCLYQSILLTLLQPVSISGSVLVLSHTSASCFDSLSSVGSTLRSPSSPIQEEDEEKLSEMSDAQAHMLLSSSPAPTEVSMSTCVTHLLSHGLCVSHVLHSFSQGTAGDDAPDSLSPEDGEY